MVQEERLKESPKLFWIFIVFVMHRGCPLHILSMSSMKRLCAQGTTIETGGNINKTSPSKYSGKYLTSRTSILSKLILVRLILDLLLDFVKFSALTISKPKENGEG